jgi:probable HAF family extracellular repeat protein
MRLKDSIPRPVRAVVRATHPDTTIARTIGAVAVVFALACRTDAIVEPISSDRLAPTEPDLVLTGGVGTPIFPTSVPGEPQAKGFAIGLNGAGQVTGGAHDLFTSGDEGNKPFRWTPGGPLVKLTSCCENGFGADINATGVVVGSIEAGPNNAYRPFVATGNSVSFLPLLPGIPNDIETQESHAKALAINDAGDIVGFSPVNGTSSHAVRWNASHLIADLGTLGGSRSQAVDINNAGLIIGMSHIAGDAASHAFLWSSGTGMQDLNTLLGATITSVLEINDAGQIVGTYTASGGQSHAFRYTPGSGLLDLGTLGGTSSEPTGLNSRGEVVGSSTLAGGGTHAFLWTPSDGMEDVTALTGVAEIRRLNDNLQTLTVTAPPTGTPTLGTQIPRLVQLEVTESDSPPIAAFTWSCNGLTCTLDASNSIDDKPGLTYSWDLNKFPDGSATGKLVTVTYPHVSTRTVTLTVTDSKGQSSTSSQTFNVDEPQNSPPIASFTFTCTDLTCSFDATGSTDDKGIVSYVWDLNKFPDGSATGATATTTYPHSGVRYVTLTVTDAEGASNSITRAFEPSVNTADAAPVARFTSSCSGTVCTFDASTSTDDVGITSYVWSLGKYPDNDATGVTVTTDYWHTSTRTVTLTVTDTKGQTNSVTKTITIP